MKAVWAARLAALCLCAHWLACAGTASLPSPEIKEDVVVFRLQAPAARIVQVSGSWQENFELRGRDWHSDQRVGLMARNPDTGTWELAVPLGPGRYEYLFLIDGRFWELDRANPQRVSDGLGGQRSVVVVP